MSKRRRNCAERDADRGGIRHPESPLGIEGSSKFGLWAVSDEQTQAGTARNAMLTARDTSS